MRDRYKFKKDTNELHFITMVVRRKVPVFTNKELMSIMVDNFRFYQGRGLRVFFYVIMDNHVHMIVSHENRLAETIASLKSYTSRQILSVLRNDKRGWVFGFFKNKENGAQNLSGFQFWESGNHPKLINGWDMLEQKADYIHNNPVKRGLVSEAESWVYSSAREFYHGDGVFKIDRLD